MGEDLPESGETGNIGAKSCLSERRGCVAACCLHMPRLCPLFRVKKRDQSTIRCPAGHALSQQAEPGEGDH